MNFLNRLYTRLDGLLDKWDVYKVGRGGVAWNDFLLHQCTTVLQPVD